MKTLLALIFLFSASAFAQAMHLSASQIEQHLRAAQIESPSYRDIPITLTESPAFTALWQRPGDTIRHARSLLLNPNLKANDKFVLTLALQNVRWPELLQLYEWAFDRYMKGQLPSDLIDALMFPSTDWNTRLQLRYKNPPVRKLLMRIQGAKLPLEEEWLKKYIPDILSGKAADGINVARRDGQLLDRSRKD